MAKTARPKRKPAAAIGKRRRAYDLLDLPPSAFAARPPREPTPEELLEREKAREEIESALRAWGERLYESLVFRPAPLELPDDWRSSTSPVGKFSGKKWVPIAYARKPNELLAMKITDASRVLAEESETAPDCAKPLSARYIEKRLRELGMFPLARRNPLKQRPK